MIEAEYISADEEVVKWSQDGSPLTFSSLPIDGSRGTMPLKEWLDEGNSISPYEEPVTPTPILKAEAKLSVVAYADNLTDVITGPVPKAEKESWTKKERVARKYKADPATLTSDETALLQNELDVTTALDTDLGTLSDKIIVQADGFSAFAGKIAGIRRVTMKAIDDLPEDATAAEVDAVLQAAIGQAEAAFVALIGKPSGLV